MNNGMHSLGSRTLHRSPNFYSNNSRRKISGSTKRKKIQHVASMRHCINATVDDGSNPTRREQRARRALENRYFSCTECGKCCTGSGYVYCNRSEIEAMATMLYGSSSEEHVQDCVREYCDEQAMERKGLNTSDPEWFILRNEYGTNHCVFLDTATQHCKIYGTRPMQCMTYPFWPELVFSQHEWKLEAEFVCEGIYIPEEDASQDTLYHQKNKNNESKLGEEEENCEWVPVEQGLRSLEMFSSYIRKSPGL